MTQSVVPAPGAPAMASATASLHSTRPAPKIALLKPTTTADRVGFGRLVQVEFRKFIDTRAGAWLLGIGLVGMLAITIGGALLYQQLSDGMRSTDWTIISNFAGMPVSLLVPVMVILLFTTEWTQRTTLTTFALEPRRGRVLAAKGVVALLVAVAMWVLQYAMSAGGSLLGGAVTDVAVTWNFDWKLLLGNLGSYVLTLAMAAGFGLLLMNTPAAIVTYMALPIVVQTVALAGEKAIQVLQWVDLGNASTPLLTGEWVGNDGWQLLVASLIWVVAPIVAGVTRTLRTEAK